jgi:sterol 3beta-glucosyltransferase
MRVLMVSVGSRGDAEPYCALAEELLKRNHKVDLFLQSDLRPLAKPLEEAHQDFHVRVLPFTNQDYYNVSRGQRRQQHPDPKMKNVGIVADIICELVCPCVNQIQAVAEQCDVMITCALARPLCLSIAHSMNIQTVILHLQPLVPNRIFPNYRVSKTHFVEAILDKDNNIDHPEYEETYWKLEYALAEFFLKERLKQVKVGMTPIPWQDLQQILSGHKAQFLVANAYSNHLIPSIQDTPCVGPHVHEIGPLADDYLPPHFIEPPSLIEFFESCDQNPICIGFGSMPFHKVEIILEALRLLGRKAVLVGDSLRIPEAYPHEVDGVRSMTYQVSAIPYSYLLPRCSMMLCHGGAGVVHACLRAGIPCLISPIMGDQFSFAALVQAKGLGVQCGTKLSQLSSGEIVQAVRQASACTENCRILGGQIRPESCKSGGVQILADLLEDTIIS